MTRQTLFFAYLFLLIIGCNGTAEISGDNDAGNHDVTENDNSHDVGDDADTETALEDTGDDVKNDAESLPSNNQKEPPSSDGTLVIMPLGDSMTNDSRPRVTLWNLLVEDGHELDYVGDQTQTSSIPDPDHEGVGGIKIQGIADKTEHLMSTHSPEYVALMVGTNDIAWYFDETGEEIADRWNDLIELIFEHSDAGTYILAATIPPVSSQVVGKDTMPERDRAVLVSHYNAAIRQHVDTRIDNEELIILADMEAFLDPDNHLSSDGVHLNEEGYTIMGTVYYQALTNALIEQQE